MSSYPPLRKIGFSLMALLLLGAALPGAVQAETFIKDDTQAWQILTLRGHLTKRFMGYLDTQNFEVNLTNKPGNSFHQTHEGQLVIRPALGFQLTKTLSVWEGFGWAPSYQPQFRNEFQAWEQLLYERHFKHLNVTNRIRLEHRYIENAGNGAALRMREQLRLAVPLGKSKWSLVASDEGFYNLNSMPTGPKHGFNQNWFFVGIGRRLTKTLNLDVGYLNNFVRSDRPIPNRMNHVFFVLIACNLGNAGFDLRKPKDAAANLKTAEETSEMPSILSAVDFTSVAIPVATGDASAVTSSSAIQPDLEIAPVFYQPDGKAAVAGGPVSVATSAHASANEQ